MMKLLLYTTLFVDSRLVAYKIYFNPENERYLFKPTLAGQGSPTICIGRSGEGWQFEGCHDNHTRSQVMEDIKNLKRLRQKPIL
jgi:hypothetical protein